MLFHGQRTPQTKFEQEEKLNGDATERDFCGLPEIAGGATSGRKIMTSTGMEN